MNAPRKSTTLTIVALITIGFSFGLSNPTPSSIARAQDKKKAATKADDVNPPVIEGLGPPGIRIGDTARWTITGKGLAKVTSCLISNDSIKTKIVGQPTDSKLEVEASCSSSTIPGYQEFRVVAPTGVSNLMLIRTDHLPQVPEKEPNDAPESAQIAKAETVITGTIKPLDLDHFKITGKAGAILNIDMEARRLAVPITSLITIYAPDGQELAQGREVQGADGDCRMTFLFPKDGDYILQVRDNIYAGGDAAYYRLRLTNNPIPTGVFPLGGAKGQNLKVIVSGGGLSDGWSKMIRLPDRAGRQVDPGPFSGPGGLAAITPMEIIVGNGPEVFESESEPGSGEPVLIPLGGVANGRISKPGEVDRYRIQVKKGQSLRLRIMAGELGSWLDSVLLLRDPKGNILADNDEPDPAQRPGVGALPADDPRIRDSRLEYEPKADGLLTVEVHDRFGTGGPEYAYRLDHGSATPEMAIVVLLRPLLNANQRVQAGGTNRPGANGSLNLKAGVKTPIDFQVSGIGFQGKVEVRAEGLPPGVTVEPVTVRLSRGTNRNNPLRTATDRLVFNVAKDAKVGVLGELRVIAIAKTENGETLEQTAMIPVTLDSVKMSTPIRPITRETPVLPVMVLESGKP